MKKIILLIMLFASGSVNAGAYKGNVINVYCSSVTGICSISLANGISKLAPNCSPSGNTFAFDSTTNEGKNMLSLSLAALIGARYVSYTGSGTCTILSYSQNLTHISMQ